MLMNVGEIAQEGVFCPIDKCVDTKTFCTKHGIWGTIGHPCHKCEDGEEVNSDNGLQLQIYGRR